jgi:RNA-directed DNA polymerase
MWPRPPEPKGKLDAMLTDTTVDAVTVNGPEDVLSAWDAIDWQAGEEEVRRLRQRIFKAAQEQDWPKVRNRQKLMLRSRSNMLVSVRQVTQRNAGRRTAGIDGEVARHDVGSPKAHPPSRSAFTSQWHDRGEG